MEIECKTSKKQNNITKQICNSFIIINMSSIIIGLFIISFNSFFRHFDEPKQHRYVINNKRKFLKNLITVPLLWLDDNEIIWDAGVECENESIDQGRSYVDENIYISLCFF